MNTVLIILALILALAVIGLVILLPRESQRFYTDTTSSIGKSGYWESQTLVKVSLLITSLALFALLLIFMVVSY